MGDTVHTYRAELRWEGSTGVGYDSYGRGHEIVCPPSGAMMAMSSDPSFGGDARCWNPEQLLLAAASSCQMLSFLATAARARVDVKSYRDDSEAFMPEGERPVRVAEIVLRPRIVIAPAADDDVETLLKKATRLVDVAHRGCFIANSLNSEVRLEPHIELVAD